MNDSINHKENNNKDGNDNFNNHNDKDNEIDENHEKFDLFSDEQSIIIDLLFISISVQDKNYKYYLEYCKLTEANELINNQLQLLMREKQNLTHQVNKYQVRSYFGNSRT